MSHRLWISTTSNWTSNAINVIKGQSIPLSFIKVSDLQNAPVEWDKLEEGVHG